MTANQLKWQSNQIAKAQLAETERANMRSEALEEQKNRISSAKNAIEAHKVEVERQLKEQGLALQRDEDLMKLTELYAKYGNINVAKAPPSIQRELASHLGFENKWKNEESLALLQEAFDKMKDVFSGFFSFKL